MKSQTCNQNCWELNFYGMVKRCKWHREIMGRYEALWDSSLGIRSWNQRSQIDEGCWFWTIGVTDWVTEWVSEIVTTREAIASKNNSNALFWWMVIQNTLATSCSFYLTASRVLIIQVCGALSILKSEVSLLKA